MKMILCSQRITIQKLGGESSVQIFREGMDFVKILFIMKMQKIFSC